MKLINLLELTTIELRNWALFSHFYEKGFAKIKKKNDVMTLSQRLRQLYPQHFQAIEYFKNYRLNQIN